LGFRDIRNPTPTLPQGGGSNAGLSLPFWGGIKGEIIKTGVKNIDS